MKVFIVVSGADYETSDIDGVYDSYEKARAKIPANYIDKSHDKSGEEFRSTTPHVTSYYLIIEQEVQ